MTQRLLTASLLVGVLPAFHVAGLEPFQDKMPDAVVVTTRKSGKIKLAKGHAKATKVELGKRVDATAEIHITDFLGRDVVSAQLKVGNGTKKDVHLSYHVAFFDKRGQLLAAGSSRSKVEPQEGKIQSILSVLVELPREAIGKVATYQALLYEADEEIGKR